VSGSTGLQRTQVGDIAVAWEMSGPAQAPVVMLAHGVLASHRLWDGVAARLAQDWRVLRYDLRGHGATQATPGDYPMAQLAADAVGLLDALGLQRVHLVGLSLGGMLAQQVGALHGERLLSLTLANTASVQGAPAAWQQRIDTARRQGLEPLIMPTLERWFTPAAFTEQPQVVAEVGAIARQTSVDGFAGCAAAVRDLAHGELLARIEVPTLVIAGAQDQATPVAASEAMVAAIRGARLAVLPAAHQSATECPEAFAACWRAARVPA